MSVELSNTCMIVCLSYGALQDNSCIYGKDAQCV